MGLLMLREPWGGEIDSLALSSGHFQARCSLIPGAWEMDRGWNPRDVRLEEVGEIGEYCTPGHYILFH